MTTTMAKRKGPSLSKAAREQQDLVHALHGEAGGNGHVNGTKRIPPASDDDLAAAAAFNSKHGGGKKDYNEIVNVPLSDQACVARVYLLRVPPDSPTASDTAPGWYWGAAWSHTDGVRGEDQSDSDTLEEPCLSREQALEAGVGYLTQTDLVNVAYGAMNDLLSFVERGCDTAPTKNGKQKSVKAAKEEKPIGADWHGLVPDSDATNEALTPGPSPAEGGRREKRASRANAANEGTDRVDAVAQPPGGEIEIELRDLVRHEDNRRPTAESVAARAESLKTHGQFEALVVRDLGHKLHGYGRYDHLYQILSGETRYLAAKQLGWKSVRARVVPCTDAEALVRLAEHNAQREDLTAIDKARLIQRLCAAEADGGAGLTREAAGKHVGYASGSAASNVVRLLELPAVWQERVAKGELAETFARCLLPIAKAPTLMERAEADWTKAHRKGAKSWDAENWERREDVEGFVEELMEEAVPMDAAEKVSVPWHLVKDHSLTRPERRLFEVTDAVREKLKVEVIEWNGKEVEVATNFELFYELQAKAIRAKVAKKQDKEQKGAKSAKGKSASQANAANGPKVSAAERKYLAERKRKADRERVERWRHAWLAELVSEKLADGAHAGPTLKVALFCLTVNWNRFDVRREVDLEKLILKALPGGSDVTKALNARLAGDNAGVQHCALAALAAVMAQAVRVPARPGYPQIIETDLIEGLIADLSIDVDHEWGQDAEARKAFYSLFSSEQLEGIAKGLNVHLLPGKPKSVKVSLLAAKTARPSALKPVLTGGKARGQGRVKDGASKRGGRRAE